MAKTILVFQISGSRLWTTEDVPVPRIGEAVAVPGHAQEQYEVTGVGYKYERDQTRVVVECRYLHGTDRFHGFR